MLARSKKLSLHEESLAALGVARQNAGVARKIVFVSGNFNVIHPGHLRILKFARECGDFLVVGVRDQINDGAILDEALRLEGVAAVSLVNHAFLLHDAPEDFIRELKPDFVVKGKEHEHTSDPEKAAVESGGGKLLFCSGDAMFSSVDFLKKEFSRRQPAVIVKPLDFPARHGFTLDDLKKTVTSFAGMRVLVIGDLIIDEYIECDPLGMSQEDPTLVVAPVFSQQFVGGAGIVAGHARGLGTETSFLSIANDDAAAQFAEGKLNEYGASVTLLRDDSRPTTLKQRYRAGGKTLLRVSHLKQHWIDTDLQEQLVAAAKPLIRRADLVIFSDFSYGCLPQQVVDGIAALCEETGVPFAADSQSSSQVGDIGRFKNALLIKPTEREARLVLRDFTSGLITVITELQKSSNAKNIALTLGAEGVIARAAKTGKLSGWVDDRLPAFNAAPKDTAGAGDSFLISTALALASGADLWKGVYIGSLAAACQVARLGNIPLSASDILAELKA